MKQNKKKAMQEKREHRVGKLVLALVLPAAALLIAVSFVLLSMTYGTVRRELSIEFGEDTPDAAAFLRSETGEAEYDAAPETRYLKAGDYKLRVRVNGRVVPVVLRVRDTIAPTAEGAEQTVPAGRELTPDKLIRNLKDQGLVKVTYETAPDYFTVGDYDAVVLLEDESGNTARVSVPVHVRTVIDGITVEAGDPAPTADAFLIAAYDKVTMSQITDEMLHEPGEYTVRITADGIEAESRLIVRDTVPPTGRGVTQILAPGETVKPGMLVTDISDQTAVTAAFAEKPDPDSRDPQTIPLTLTDRGGNVTTVYGTLLFTDAIPTVIEARTMGLSVTEILEEGTYTEAALSMQFIPDDVGQHVLAVTVDGKRNIAVIEVRDTTPPEIGITRPQWYLDRPTGVDTLAYADDVTDATLEYLTEPDWSLETQEVTLVATDPSGNRSEKTFTLTLAPDTEPPELYGVRDRYCYVDEPTQYLSEVYAWDDCDGDVEVTVDASAVDISRVGNYTAVYSATDSYGNTTTKTAVIRVVASKVGEDRAQELADEIIAEILTDDMTLAEQIEAIYDYVFNNVHYIATSSKQDWRGEAVRGLTTGRGDCFTSYAAARLLLEQTDAQIVSVQRMDDVAHHYWMLVNIGTGWYHFDACRTGAAKKRCFMWTDAQTERVSKKYWHYDKTLYPPVATEPFSGGK